MNKLILTIILFFSMLTNLNAQWEIINEGFRGGIYTIDFVDENTGWIAGGNGTLLKTTDGGENWNTIDIDETWDINQIDFIDESIGWAIGNAHIGSNKIYYIWKTSNAGISWSEQFSSTQFGFSALYVIDVNNIYTIGGDQIYKTTNSGTNWVDVSPNLPDRSYNSVWLQNPQIGVVVGSYNDGTVDRGVILKTTDGGTDWVETIVKEFNSIYDLQFLDSNNGYFRAHLDTSNFICKTDDMFSSWTVKTQHPYSIASYQFLDSSSAYAIMSDSIIENNIMKSIDGGISWQNIQSTAYSSLGKIYFNNLISGFILGSIYGYPLLYKFSESGFDWEIQKFRHPINDINFADKDNGCILGYSVPGAGHSLGFGIIFSSTNGGKTWKLKYGKLRALFIDILLINQFIGYSLASMRGTVCMTDIYKSTDGGNNWVQVYENNSDSTGYSLCPSNDICFIDQENGFAAGRYGDSISNGAGILYTNNGGENWDLGWRFPDTANYEYNLKSIHFINSTGWTVGDGGMIVKYTPQTGWAKQTSVTDLPLSKVFFTDDYHGWIAGGYQSNNDFQTILLKTTNGGINWNIVTNVPYLMRDVAFIDNNLGWAIGYTQDGSGGILKTTDGGTSWTVNTGNLPEQLNALFIKDNYGWAVGEGGLILRTTNAGPVWLEHENNNTYPTEFVLEQNYPNPFNPSTKIRYSIPINQQTIKVKLIVFDILGREVATLIDENQKSGNYEVDFSYQSGSGSSFRLVRNLTSGVYLYRLTAGDYTATKKMILLK